MVAKCSHAKQKKSDNKKLNKSLGKCEKLLTTSKLEKGKCVGKAKGKGNNNNAVPVGLIEDKNHSNRNGKQNKLSKTITKIVPIIQTRGMKAKEKICSLTNKEKESELKKLNQIDQLLPHEIAGGDVSSDEEGEICNDGVELSINGSELDEEFPEESSGEPGKIIASDEDDVDQDSPPHR